MFFRKKKAAVREFVPVVMPTPAVSEMADETGAPRKKILIVDDDAVVVKALTMSLHSKGYRVLSALDASEAIGVVREKDPDMVLVDVTLPPDIIGAHLSDGFQLVRWLQIANSRKIPAVVMSGANKPEYQRWATAIGAKDFMAKPINTAVLLDLIESALAKPAPEGQGYLGLRMLDEQASQTA
jgi:CheY-like chemotaxis protein